MIPGVGRFEELLNGILTKVFEFKGSAHDCCRSSYWHTPFALLRQLPLVLFCSVMQSERDARGVRIPG